MNEIIQNFVERRSVKAYSTVPVSEGALAAILEAASYAPSGMGRQPVKMIVVQNKEVRDQLARMNAAVMGAAIDPFYGANTVIVVLADRTVSTYIYDGALVMGNLLNAAHGVGVDSCWIHRAKEVFDSKEGRILLQSWGIEGDYEGIGNCLLGYRAGEYPVAMPRKEDMIVRVK